MNARIPKIVLKSLFESFRTDSAERAQQKMATVDGLSAQDGEALAMLARSSKDFAEFESLINAEVQESPVSRSARVAAKHLGLKVASESKWPWESVARVTTVPA